MSTLGLFGPTILFSRLTLATLVFS
ncbi:hypothetical protein DMN91_008376 [Ooceraea biroi]|uniref:Uncharacterized protein n=1 Tax=Ooceraea biroi TaxID=2015173 RepID=A0A3L8DHB8_OOCBI|nr:hypothetical protein DMN91_008376 [Ooceraea biroi]